MIHTVKQGDSIPSIAYAAGLSPDTVWDHPNNQDLKKLRKNMNVLLPGDQVFVPEKRRKTETGATDRKHKFLRKGVPSRIRVQLFDVETPRASQAYELEVGGTVYRGTTDDKGTLEEWVPPDAREAHLTIGDDQAVFVLKLGHLDPMDELAGAQKRLTNLGYPCGEQPGQMDDATHDALRSFQRRFRLKETGEFDDDTKARLNKFHDRNNLFDPDPWLAGS